MAATLNLTGGGAQLGASFVRSISWTAFKSVEDRTEVPPDQALYFEVDMFGGNNGNGAFFGQAHIATLNVPIPAYSGRSSLTEILQFFLPPKGSDV
jgi:hypothetical protein